MAERLQALKRLPREWLANGSRILASSEPPQVLSPACIHPDQSTLCPRVAEGGTSPTSRPRHASNGRLGTGHRTVNWVNARRIGRVGFGEQWGCAG